MDRPLGETVKLKIGRISAFCPGCGNEDFARTMVAPGLHSDVLVCIKCGVEMPRGALIEQVAREAVRQGNEALEKAKAWRKFKE